MALSALNYRSVVHSHMSRSHEHHTMAFWYRSGRVPRLFTLIALLLLACTCDAFGPTQRRQLSPLHSRRVTKTPRLILSDEIQHEKLRLGIASTASDDESSVSSWFSQPAVPFGLAWVSLLAFTAVAPGEMADPKDLALVQAVIDNPVDPDGVNKLFYFIFNLFAIIPVSIACLAFPQQTSKRGLPATPFVLLSTFIGYFALGPYMTFRQTQEPPVTGSSLNWFTRNVLENKLFSWSTALFGLYLPFASGVVEPLLTNPVELWQGYVEYWSTSKLGSVSSVDLAFLTIATATMIPLDYRLRRPDADPSVGRTIGALSLLVPVIGSALYCAWRPPLPQDE